MNESYKAAEQWSNEIANLIVDALQDANLIEKIGVDKSIEIVAEEIFVRLCCRDYPPQIKDEDNDVT